MPTILADTFTSSLARLANDEQKQAKLTAFDLQANPDQPGLQFHRIALVAGELSDRANGLGANPGYADTLIGATASCHGLSVVTRNLRHFEPLGVPCLDPFAGAD